ncbi:hypothetical protein HG536_0B01460 [Torulaspora globosa]|uniref:Uncharacterized protein n=1 Tax=Torulaspora globosa TaxID=48254 RepID=A0A7G3ZCP8_9SACH|nr:uncharacterized protein HG536_0B01460 [Torulaspora globosa]QLL31284.1 hypothetical protein HG536_0B01460 [Torulaspora globosa]
MERKVDLTGDHDALPTYTAHLVPCKVRYSGPTAEFQDNLHMDSEHHRSLKKPEAEQQCDVSHVTYIRGRKIVGRQVFGSAEYTAFLMNSSSDASGDLTMKPIARVSEIVNYERDGNEGRLHEEVGRLEELLELSDMVHS